MSQVFFFLVIETRTGVGATESIGKGGRQGWIVSEWVGRWGGRWIPGGWGEGGRVKEGEVGGGGVWGGVWQGV